MQFEVQKKTFYFQAGASSLGGVLIKPERVTITPGASTLLPSAGGGQTSVRQGLLTVDDIISAGSTEASGSGSDQDDQSTLAGRRHWLMQVSSTVQTLNLLGGKVTAAQLAIKASAKYWHDSGSPEFSFEGTQITGFMIGTCEVEIVFKKQFSACGEKYPETLPQQICIVESVTVKGECPGVTKVDHHILEVRGVGRLVFGEGVKFPGHGPVQVNLLRIDLDTSTGMEGKMNEETKDPKPAIEANIAEVRSDSATHTHGVEADAEPQKGTISVAANVVGGTQIPPI
jgi:hypothetical protein